MKKFFTSHLVALALVASIATAAVVPATTQAINVFEKSCGGSGQQAPAQGGGGASSSLCGATSGDSAPNLIKNVINLLLYLVGIIAVIAIIIGGIRYTTSNGDASNVKAAKDTILYAVIGLVVAILAYAIVNFVVAAF